MRLFEYFTDPVLQAPTMGSMLMCLSSALVGVIVFLRRRSLLGEALSHASYPGVVLSVFLTALFFPSAYPQLSWIVLIGAFCTAILGLYLIEKMERTLKVKQDCALCFVLSFFFGVGVLFASRLQFSHALWYKTVHIFLYGQAATMTDIHIILYSALSLLILTTLFFLYNSIKISLFDREYALSVQMSLKGIDSLLFILLILAIIIGIRSVGVVLMAGMLIAPAIAARALSNHLATIFLLAGLIGACSGFFGNYFSLEIPEWIGRSNRLILPTGPMILLFAALLCLLSLLFAPKSGLLRRKLRAAYFERECQRENLLKYLWKKGEGYSVVFLELRRALGLSYLKLFWMQFCLRRQGWLEKREGRLSLKPDGRKRAARIIRLHRLWEVYLVSLGQGIEKVHCSAEEMEHVLTPELEAELTLLLDNPKLDPHKQPIPSHD